MPFVESNDTGSFVGQIAPKPEPAEPPTWAQTFGAAFRMENDVVAAYQLATEPHEFPSDPLFNVGKRMRDWDAANRTNLWDNYRDNFLGVRSEQEFQYRLGKITSEQKDRETLSNAGVGGVVASIAAGTLSPTMLMPFIGAERGLAAVGKGALMGGLAGAAQEVPLQLAQETRTGGESAFSIAAATVLGGVIGGAVGALRPGEFEKLVRQLDVEAEGMGRPLTGQAIPTSAGAAAAPLAEYAGRLKAARAAKVADWLGPVTRVINQSEDRTASWFMSQLADAGLRMEGNVKGVNTAEGGTVESLIKPYYGQFALVTESLDSNYAKYIFGESSVPGFAPNARAALTGMWDNTKLSKSEFRTEVSKAIWQGEHVIPEAKAVADEIVKRILQPMLKEGQDRGIFGEVKQTADKFYFPHMWRSEVIEARTNEFVDKLAQTFSKKLNSDFGEQLARLKESERRDAQLIEDLVRPKEDLDAQKELIKAQKAALDGIQQDAVRPGFLRVFHGSRKEAPSFDPARSTYETKAVWFSTDKQVAQGFVEGKGKTFTTDIPVKDLFDYRNVDHLARVEEALKEVKNLSGEEAIMEQIKRGDWSALENPKVQEVFRKEGFKGHIGIEGDNPGLSVAIYDKNLIGKPIDTSLIGAGSRGLQVMELEDQISDLRRLARSSTGDEKANYLRQARELEASGGDALKDIRAQRSEIRRREAGLSRAAVALEEQQAKKLAAIEKIEDLNTNQLRSVARAGQRILNKLETVSDEALDKEIKNLSEKFTDLDGQLTRSEDRIAKLVENEQTDMATLLAAGERQDSIKGRMSDIARDIEAADTIDRASVRASIEEALKEVETRAMNMIEKRLARENKLIESAAKLDPAEAARRVENIRAKSKTRRIEFRERMNTMADDVDLDSASANFLPYARDLAVQAKDKVMSTNVRIPINDILVDKRGSELARVLDVSSEEFKDFLETDIERVLRAYLRTMAPDIEMARKFGSVNGSKIFDRMLVEQNDKLAALGEKAKAENWDEKRLIKETKKINESYADNQRDLEAVIGRLRGNWGLPDNPDGMAYRMGRMVMNLNVLRLMGGTLIASIPDAARPIQRYGLTRTFRDAFVPMISNWKQLQLSAREAKLAGGALDAIMHSRAQSINDILDDYGRHSKFERGLEYATNKLGMMALFDQWTVAMKQVSSSVIIGKLSDSLDIVYGGAKASAKEVKEAQEFLASKGLGAGGEKGLGQRIYNQMQAPGGGNRVNDVLMPNTEAWTDAEATRAFRGALASEINNTIITHGVERPLWMDKTMLGRVLGQFKSFGMSSTYKVALSGVQQHDMAFFTGTMVSLALGALSYYLSAVSSGGEQYQKMLKSGPGKFADEAINRSGVLGIFSDAQRFFERIPATQKYVSFSGERTTRRGGDDLIDVVLGPTMGLAKTGAKVVAGIDEPTQSTVHQMRTLLPWQNVIIWRRIMDEIEKAAGSSLPERRN